MIKTITTILGQRGLPHSKKATNSVWKWPVAPYAPGFTGGEFEYLLISKNRQKVDIWHNVYEINWDFWSVKVFCVLCSPYKSPFYFDDFFLTLSKWEYFARFERNFDQNWIYNSFSFIVVAITIFEICISPLRPQFHIMFNVLMAKKQLFVSISACHAFGCKLKIA